MSKKRKKRGYNKIDVPEKFYGSHPRETCDTPSPNQDFMVIDDEDEDSMVWEKDFRQRKEPFGFDCGDEAWKLKNMPF